MKFKVLNVLVAAILCICIVSILYLGLIVEHEYLGYDEQGTYHSPSESGSFDSYLAVRAENNTFYLTYKDVFS